MNIFELSAVATPMSDAVVGGITMQKAGLGAAIEGYAGGFILGVLFYGAVILVTAFIMDAIFPRNALKKAPDGIGHILGSFAAVGLPFISPVLCGYIALALAHILSK